VKGISPAQSKISKLSDEALDSSLKRFEMFDASMVGEDIMEDVEKIVILLREEQKKRKLH